MIVMFVVENPDQSGPVEVGLGYSTGGVSRVPPYRPGRSALYVPLLVPGGGFTPPWSLPTAGMNGFAMRFDTGSARTSLCPFTPEEPPHAASSADTTTAKPVAAPNMRRERRLRAQTVMSNATYLQGHLSAAWPP